MEDLQGLRQQLDGALLDVRIMRRERTVWMQRFDEMAIELGGKCGAVSAEAALQAEAAAPQQAALPDGGRAELQELAGMAGLASDASFAELRARFSEYLAAYQRAQRLAEAVAAASAASQCPGAIEEYATSLRAARAKSEACFASVRASAAATPEMRAIADELAAEWEPIGRIVAAAADAGLDAEGRTLQSCDFLTGTLLPAWRAVQGSIAGKNTRLSAMIDALAGGAVRVYVRIRPRTAGADGFAVGPGEGELQRNVIAAVGTAEPIYYGPFFSVFSDAYGDNGAVFAGTLHRDAAALGGYGPRSPLTGDAPVNGLYTLSGTLTPGRTVVLFGYGLSGSGKTYTLFGTRGTRGTEGSEGAEGNAGVVQLMLQDLAGEGRRARLESAVELYGGVVRDLPRSQTNWTQLALRAQMHLLYGDAPRFAPATSVVDDKAAVLGEAGDFAALAADAGAPQALQRMVAAMDAVRLRGGRIKATPLNETSSRSHLVLTFAVPAAAAAAAAQSRFVVMDLAGKEDPVVYAMRMFQRGPAPEGDRRRRVIGADDTVKDVQQSLAALVKRGHMLGGEIAMNPGFELGGALEVLSEGIYVNETLNQLAYYTRRASAASAAAAENVAKPRRMASADVGHTTQTIVGRGVRSKVYDPNLAVDDYAGPQAGVTLMLPLLASLSAAEGAPGEATKFAMLCCVRQDGDATFVDETLASLRFASAVSSRS